MEFETEEFIRGWQSVLGGTSATSPSPPNLPSLHLPIVDNHWPEKYEHDVGALCDRHDSQVAKMSECAAILRKQLLADVFAAFDLDGNGFVDPQELMALGTAHSLTDSIADRHAPSYAHSRSPTVGESVYSLTYIYVVHSTATVGFVICFQCCCVERSILVVTLNVRDCTRALPVSKHSSLT